MPCFHAHTALVSQNLHFWTFSCFGFLFLVFRESREQRHVLCLAVADKDDTISVISVVAVDGCGVTARPKWRAVCYKLSHFARVTRAVVRQHALLG